MAGGKGAAGSPAEADTSHPRFTAGLAGHQAAERLFLDAYASGRLHHAWLLTGPQGIGKATLAYRIARFLLKHGPAEGMGGLFGPAIPDRLDVAADDPVFRRIAAGGHADLLTIEREVNEKTGKLRSEIAVDQVREVTQFLHLTAAEGGWRIVLIDPADDLNTNAANALLKVLEEPPRRAMLLLVSHAPGGLLPTIRSRCRTLRLAPLEPPAMDQWMAGALPDVTGEDRALLLELAEGAPGRAQVLAAQGGMALVREFLAFFASLPRPDYAKLHALGDRLAKADALTQFQDFFALLDWWVQRLARAVAVQGTPPDRIPGEAAAGTALLAAARGLDRVLETWEKTRALVRTADALNLDRKQVVISGLLSYLSADTPNPRPSSPYPAGRG